MTGLLRDTLAERAAGTEPPHVDLGRIIADGNHRIRRRRLGAVAIAVATSAVLAVAWTVVRRGDEVQPAGSFTERRPTYAVGSKIHYGDTTIDVGKRVGSFVQTDSGFVFSTNDGEVLFADGHDVRRIGDGDTSGRLAADDTGSLVGWADQAGPMTDDGAVDVDYVVYDTARGEEVLRTDLGGRAGPLEGTADAPVLVAIDDGSAYVSGTDGVYKVDIARDDSLLLKQHAGPEWLVDVARTWLVFAPHAGVADAEELVVNSNPLATTPQFAAATGDLSPDGRYLLAQSQGRTTLSEVATGKPLPLRYDGAQDLFGWRWLDGDRFTALAPRDPGSGDAVTVDLVMCEVGSASCTTAAAGVATYEGEGDPGLRLPDGRPAE